jgi:PAS domain S-box-containing protein
LIVRTLVLRLTLLLHLLLQMKWTHASQFGDFLYDPASAEALKPLYIYLALASVLIALIGSVAIYAVRINWRLKRSQIELGQRTHELELQNQILQSIGQGNSLPQVLDELTRHVEMLHPEMLCSILLLDEDGKTLRLGAAPSLPDFYNKAIDGLVIGDGVGSCGSAAFIGQRVVVEDIREHPFWAKFQDISRAAGLRSCWSQPFKQRNGRVLGTFAIYHRAPSQPTSNEISLIQGYASLAELAVERAQTEKALRESQTNYRLIADHSSDVIWLLALPSMKFTYISPAIERLRGWTAEEVMQQPFEAAMTEASGRRVSALLSDILQRIADGDYAARFASAEVEQPCKDGRIIITEVVATILLDDNGQPKQILGITRDISERKKAESELAQYRLQLERKVEERTTALSVAKESAEAANRAKSTFLANMSHELRTPMNAIMGMTDLALRRSTDVQQKEQLLTVVKASRNLLAIINDILDISKIEAERLTLDLSAFRLSSVIDNLHSLIGFKAAEKKLPLRIDIDPALANTPLIGDPLRLGQILLNLTSNAVKFTEAGSITVRIELLEEIQDDLLIRFEVRDTGIGISPADQRRLFFAFVQADGSTTRKYGGTGLGLAISQQLAQMMGGKIQLESQPGIGSVFSFCARLTRAKDFVEAEPVSAEDSAENRLSQHCAGQRILLVEDEPINQEVSKGLLAEVGLLVDLAEDGEEAVKRAQEGRYDLILMDIQMPRMNGIDATRAIRQLPGLARTPIIAMTANAYEEDRQRCLEAGMNDHIGKPVDPDLLFETLLHWLPRNKR